MNKFSRKIALIPILLGAGMIFIGANRGEVDIVLNKAIRICLECIGIG
ncbi:MAG: CD1871A family CXXC motif-containing protein [Finegoldia sp.]|nr:CD1871A family CXXC motif-containing protein [Finegoldia sp.]